METMRYLGQAFTGKPKEVISVLASCSCEGFVVFDIVENDAFVSFKLEITYEENESNLHKVHRRLMFALGDVCKSITHLKIRRNMPSDPLAEEFTGKLLVQASLAKEKIVAELEKQAEEVLAQASKVASETEADTQVEVVEVPEPKRKEFA